MKDRKRKQKCSYCQSGGHNIRTCGVVIAKDVSDFVANFSRASVAGEAKVGDFNHLAEIVNARIGADMAGEIATKSVVDFVTDALNKLGSLTGLKGERRQLYIQTEENPDLTIIKRIFRATTGDKKSNFSGFLSSSGTHATLYDYNFYKVPTQRKYIASVEICKGESGSTVDYVSFYERGGKLSIYSLEATKTKPSDSGNAVSQRIGKMFWVRENLDRDITMVIQFGDLNEMTNESRAWIRDFAILKANGVEILNLPDHIKIPPIKNLNDLKKLEETIGIEEGKRRIRIEGEPDGPITVYIDAKLSKDGKPAYDPNIGFVTGLAQRIRDMDKPDSEVNIVVTGHDLENFLKDADDGEYVNNKLFRALNKLNFTLDGVDMKKLKKRVDHSKDKGKYYVPATGEKVGSIFAHTALVNVLKEDGTPRYEVIFENHAGSGLSNFKKGDKEFPIKNGMSKIPDAVLYDTVTGALIIFEGKIASSAHLGDEDLDKLDDFGGFIEQYCTAHYPKSNIVKMLITYGPKAPKATRHPCLHIFPGTEVETLNIPA